jgi:hypothetical protein
MRDDLNIDLVFPIRDGVSAWLMCVKAELLYDSGVVNLKELNTVIERAAKITAQLEKMPDEPLLARARSKLRLAAPTP